MPSSYHSKQLHSWITIFAAEVSFNLLISHIKAAEGVLSFSEFVPNPFSDRSCNKICSNQNHKSN